MVLPLPNPGKFDIFVPWTVSQMEGPSEPKLFLFKQCEIGVSKQQATSFMPNVGPGPVIFSSVPPLRFGSAWKS